MQGLFGPSIGTRDYLQDALAQLTDTTCQPRDPEGLIPCPLHGVAGWHHAHFHLHVPSMGLFPAVQDLLPGQPTVARRIHQHHRERRSWYVSCAHRGAAGLHGCSRPRAATPKKKDSGVLGCFWCHGVRALLLCFARAPALLTCPPC